MPKAGFPGEDYDMEEFSGGCTEQRFRANSDLQEGVAGCAGIDTKYENTERTQVLRPRSASKRPNDLGGRSPTDASEHGEWNGTGPIRPVGAY